MGYDKRISELPQAGSLDGTELLAVVQSGVTKYTQANNLNYITSNNYGLYVQTGDGSPVSGSSSPIQTSGSLFDGGVGSLTIPANTFKVGDAFHLKMAGKINIANGNDIEIQFKSNNVTLVDTGFITLSAASNKNWNLDVTFVIRNVGTAGVASILSTGNLVVRKDGAGGETVDEIFSSENNTTFDTTIQNTLQCQAILDSACTAAENIYSQLFVLHKLY